MLNNYRRFDVVFNMLRELVKLYHGLNNKALAYSIYASARYQALRRYSIGSNNNVQLRAFVKGTLKAQVASG